MLEAVIWACLGGAALSFAFGLWALARDPIKVEETAKELNQAATAAAKQSVQVAAAGDPQGLAAQSAQQALAGGLSEYIKALSELAGNLSKLKQGVAGLFIAFALLGLAGGLAAVDDKVADKDGDDKVVQNEDPACQVANQRIANLQVRLSQANSRRQARIVRGKLRATRQTARQFC